MDRDAGTDWPGPWFGRQSSLQSAIHLETCSARKRRTAHRGANGVRDAPFGGGMGLLHLRARQQFLFAACSVCAPSAINDVRAQLPSSRRSGGRRHGRMGCTNAARTVSGRLQPSARWHRHPPPHCQDGCERTSACARRAQSPTQRRASPERVKLSKVRNEADEGRSPRRTRRQKPEGRSGREK